MWWHGIFAALLFPVLVPLAFVTRIVTRPGQADTVSWDNAPALLFGMAGLFSFIGALLFMDRDPRADVLGVQMRPGPPSERRRILSAEPYTGLLRLGLALSVCMALGAILWRLIYRSAPVGETVWGGYGVHPLTVVLLFLACWASFNLGTSLIALLVTLRTRMVAATMSAVGIVALGCGAAGLFAWMAGLRVALPLVVAVVVFALSLWALHGARRVMVKYVESEPEPVCPKTSAPSSVRRPVRRVTVEQLSRTVLGAGERVLLLFCGSGVSGAEFLAVTDQRLLHGGIAEDGPHPIRQVPPPAVAGSELHRGAQSQVIVRLRDGSGLGVRLSDGDDAVAEQFVAELNRLTGGGRMPENENTPGNR